MTEQQARTNGFTRTGHYSRNKDKMKEKAAQIRKQGNKAVVATLPDSPLSRGIVGRGYGVFWIESSENAATREAEMKQSRLRNLEVSKQQLLEKIAEIDAKIAAEMGA